MGPASSGQWISFKSEAGILGKYIVVQQQYKGFLTFAEVEVTQGTKFSKYKGCPQQRICYVQILYKAP